MRSEFNASDRDRTAQGRRDNSPAARRAKGIHFFKGNDRAALELDALTYASVEMTGSTTVPTALTVVPGTHERAHEYGARRRGSTRDPSRRRHEDSYSTIRRIASVAAGMALAGGAAYGATNWVVGLTSGSSGEGQAATVQNLTITTVASPSPTNELYPGGTGDVVVTITNPNPYPVTLTGLALPTNTTYATGYTTSALSASIAGCSATTSDVSWGYATSTSGTLHTLTTALVIGPNGNANNPLTITFTNDASMSAAAPAACEGAYFAMPALTGISASGGSATVTSTPVVDSWIS